ncbi:hypothetical protein AS850_04885 [Frondihabitans sp. 762G35]|uniref:ArnT family glycosyltransferase n=1 Tax=Frondihabitans sp. 762G35 TaxID=1446794 RepID=UPI000D21B1BA|nr:glycosyltransferase family 39 protein [Frondihabitans sp. 762G35]ARC56409.1 hypothetical protein AS850_04885 [Frondihabitans sp. 762G35]
MSTTTYPTAPPQTATEQSTGGSRASGFLRRLAVGRADAPRWERPALWGLVVLSAFVYIWDLAVSGYANAFYSAAVQAGSTNWEAFFFGSSDAANSITVDKPPASLWVMELSVRLFGLSSWSILLPEALMGVATVFLVYVIVRRHFSAVTALAAGLAMMLTPVAVLMFRFNNPDAMLLLLMTLSVYLTQRGIESGRIRWVVWAGVVVGFGFLTKQLQGFVILPALAGVYFLASPVKVGKRLLHLLAAFGGVVVGAGWWVAIVTLVPASMRPYIGGSQNNSFLELTFGYNGFGRLTGNETGSVTGGGGTAGAGSWGSTGLTRLFSSEIGGQISWFIPAALIVLVGALVVIGRRPRTDLRRATLLLFASWFVVTALVFSFAGGIFHPYYTVALAAPLAGTIAIGFSTLWTARAAWWPRIVMAVAVLATAGWGWVLLDRSPTWLPWLKVVVAIVSVLAAALLLLPPLADRLGRRRASGVAATTVALLVIGGLAAPAAYSVETVTTAHTGSIPSAGPTVAGGRGGFGGGGAGRGGFARPGGTGAGTGTVPGGAGFPAGGTLPGGTAPGGTAAGGTGTTTGGFPGRGGAGGGGFGGLFGGGGTVSASLRALLLTDSSDYTWVAATIGSDTAASYQLATQKSVMPIGGFNGSDPSPTLAQFKAYVAAGKIHYFIGGSVGRSNGGSDTSSQISAWVKANYTAKTVGSVTVYDLSD